MQIPTNWIQWAVVFLVLSAGGWLAYPEIDPLGGSSGLSLLHRVNEDAVTQAVKDTPNVRQVRGTASLLTSVP